jgi:transposase
MTWSGCTWITAHVIVLCVDETSQIQALERTQPPCPVAPGRRPDRRTHDYRRHGTTTRFAALEVTTGQLTDVCHPRVRLHFTPTYASWLNLVEVFCSTLERQALRRGDFGTVEELVAAIGRFGDGWNHRCQPFRWTKDADQVLVQRNR